MTIEIDNGDHLREPTRWATSWDGRMCALWSLDPFDVESFIEDLIGDPPKEPVWDDGTTTTSALGITPAGSTGSQSVTVTQGSLNDVKKAAWDQEIEIWKIHAEAARKYGDILLKVNNG